MAKASMAEKTHIACLGASTVSGIGSNTGEGWPDRLRKGLSPASYAVYNLAEPGATIMYQLKHVMPRLDTIRRLGDHVISIVQPGTNNAVAIGMPDRFTTTPEAYGQQVHDLLKELNCLSAQVICFGMMPMDQTRVMPTFLEDRKGRLRPVYFPNSRICQFEAILGKEAEAQGVPFVPLFGAVPGDWTENYLALDGIHPNESGHAWLSEQVRIGLDRVATLPEEYSYATGN